MIPDGFMGLPSVGSDELSRSFFLCMALACPASQCERATPRAPAQSDGEQWEHQRPDVGPATARANGAKSPGDIQEPPRVEHKERAAQREGDSGENQNDSRGIGGGVLHGLESAAFFANYVWTHPRCTCKRFSWLKHKDTEAQNRTVNPRVCSEVRVFVSPWSNTQAETGGAADALPAG